MPNAVELRAFSVVLIVYSLAPGATPDRIRSLAESQRRGDFGRYLTRHFGLCLCEIAI